MKHNLDLFGLMLLGVGVELILFKLVGYIGWPWFLVVLPLVILVIIILLICLFIGIHKRGSYKK